MLNNHKCTIYESCYLEVLDSLLPRHLDRVRILGTYKQLHCVCSEDVDMELLKQFERVTNKLREMVNCQSIKI